MFPSLNNYEISIVEEKASITSAYDEIRRANPRVINDFISNGYLRENQVLPNSKDFDVLYEGRVISSLNFIRILRKECEANIKFYPANRIYWA